MRRLKKIFLIGLLALLVAGVAGHLVWKYSGSGEWEPMGEMNGVKLYARKMPGETVKHFKGITRVRAKLETVMAASQDPDICEWADCEEATMFERVSEERQFYVFKWPYPFKFRTREMVIEQRFSRDPKTKALLVEVIAAPDKLPPNDCCVRIERMHNTWLYTPVGNGELELEYVVNMDDGGLFPYVLANYGAPLFIADQLPKMQYVLDREHAKFPNARFALLAEP
jgi:hypothetical protein